MQIGSGARLIVHEVWVKDKGFRPFGLVNLSLPLANEPKADRGIQQMSEACTLGIVYGVGMRLLPTIQERRMTVANKGTTMPFLIRTFLIRRVLGVLFAFSLLMASDATLMTSHASAASSPTNVAYSAPSIVRSERRITRERKVRTTRSDRSTTANKGRSHSSSSSRPRLVRR